MVSIISMAVVEAINTLFHYWVYPVKMRQHLVEATSLDGMIFPLTNQSTLSEHPEVVKEPV
jgi:hypothetical protein